MDEQNVKERQEICTERHLLAKERMEHMKKEETACGKFAEYFRTVSSFLTDVEAAYELVRTGKWKTFSVEEKQTWNQRLYQDVLPEQYGKSYANPTYAVKKLGEYGQLLSTLYTELRGAIPYAFEQKEEYLTILEELFLEMYGHFEEEEQPLKKSLEKTLYWYASDYSDVFLADRVAEQVDPSCDFAVKIVKESDWKDPSFLYDYGEYVTENEILTLQHLNGLPEETLKKMADVYTEGYRIGFINTGKDLSKKGSVNIRYCLGFEPVIRLAIDNFAKMGLKPVIYRASVSLITKKEQYKIGYYGAIANKQYEYDHRSDAALILDKRYVERKLEVMKHTFEKYESLAGEMAGPACMEIFGEKPFSPEAKSEAVSWSDAQNQQVLFYDSKASQITNQYIKGEERSFTIVAYPVPEIGEKYSEIFDEVIRINTLDASLYEKVQQTLIDALDQGEKVHVLGKGENQTDLWINLWKLKDPQKETIFENCVADVNIPVGEVFTSPVLKGTTGVLNVGKVYLNELQYRNLKLTFVDGTVQDYTCDNFESEEENKAYIRNNILHNHETLPMGEFAIGTNTTAYVAAKKYQIEDKMPILIAEKMGPHFAVGDTCYSWCEDIRVYNPSGKEIVAKDNDFYLLRKENVEKAYFHCHTDITIPYEELEEISVVTKNGNHIILLKDGRFVLPGTEVLNEPLKELTD